ncbi:unnamed protein product, partial [Echinostoma caproni]|uniref:V-type ATP synthase subunit D n=1 Tax=Echinostoma caproni TaxID=27848 RepID=A0A183BC88_9TREM
IRKARKAQSEAEFEVTRLKADYVEIVPKKQYEELLKIQEQQKAEIQEYMTKYTEAIGQLRCVG